MNRCLANESTLLLVGTFCKAFEGTRSEKVHVLSLSDLPNDKEGLYEIRFGIRKRVGGHSER